MLDFDIDLTKLKQAAPILTPEERERAWKEQRRGKITASMAHVLVKEARKKGEMSETAKSYLMQVAAERLGAYDENDYTSPAMQWGKDHELEAVAAIEKYADIKIHKTGAKQEFVYNKKLFIGATPDGVFKKGRANIGVEIKCPKPKQHLEYIGIKNHDDLKNIAPEYYWQVLSGMLATGYKRWLFASYDPRFEKEGHRLHYIFIFFDQVKEDVDLLKNKLKMANLYIDRIVSDV